MALPDATTLPALLPLALITWNTAFCILGWNPGAEELLGWSEQETLGHPLYELLPGAMQMRMRQIARELLEGQAAITSIHENVTRDGRSLICEWRHVRMPAEEGAPAVILSVVRDITRQHQIERERERLIAITAASSAARTLDEILLLVRSAIIEVEGFDRAGIWLKEDDAMRGTWGTDKAGQLCNEHHFRLPVETLVGAMRAVVCAGRPYSIETYETEMRTEQGAPRLCTCVVIGMIAQGGLVGVLCVDNLFTDRPIEEGHIERLLPFCEQAAVAIQNSRLLAERERLLERKRRMMEVAAAISTRLELDKILRMVRDAVVEVGGFDRAGALLVEGDYARGSWGTDREGRVSDEHDYRAPLTEWFPHIEALRSGERAYVLRSLPVPLDGGDYPCANVALRVDGQLVGMLSVDNLLTRRPIREENIEILLHFTEQAAVAIRNARLIDELRQAQETLLRSEKLRAIGELASGVAHNVNNILAAVLGYAELIQKTEGAPAQVTRYAHTIERAALDGADIVRRVQRFAHRETGANPLPFDLAAVIQEAIDLTRPAWQNQANGRGIHIEVVRRLQPGLRILGHESEMREVFVNLLKNAIDAMPEGGALTVSCYAEAGRAMASVEDTGIGMEEATRMRVCEPFFTTKSVALGTGLGLSIAWGILDRHNGRIEVRSAPGEGALFLIELPLSELPAPQAKDGGSDRLDGLRVLLVEDEEMVRDGLARMLSARGANVERCANADQALAWLAANAGQCELVLSDHGMAGMTGISLLALVRARYPHLRRVLLSGWGAKLPEGADTAAAERILTKPIRLEELVAALKSLPPHA